MKKIIGITVSLICIQRMGEAQQVSKTDTTGNKNITAPVADIILISDMDQRKTYHWDNGQRSTPAGRQAGDPLAKYVRVIGDSAVVVRDWSEKTKVSGVTAKH